MPDQKTTMYGKSHSLASLLVLAMGFIIAVALINQLRPLRLDLTEDKLYTLSDGSINLLEKLEGEPIQLTFYYSDKVTEHIPTLRAYSRRVRETLEEYVLQSEGKIELEVVDPEPFSEAEDEAVAMGLQGIPAGNDDTIYFGLVGQRAAGNVSGEGGEQEFQHETIDFFNPQQEDSLEYDISQLLYRLSRDKPLVVGLISDIPVYRHRDVRSGEVSRPKIILEQFREMFNVKHVYDSSIDHIDEEIDLLMVIHPKLWPQKTLYAIDQYVLRGGRLVAFMDPKAEMDESEQMLFGSSAFDKQNSSLEQLLTAWGVAYDQDKILLDYGFAHTIPVTRYGQALPHVGVIGIRDDGFNRDEAMTAKTDIVNLESTGVLSALEDASTRFIPLMQSSNQAQLIDSEEYSKAGNHKELLERFKADDQPPRAIAALVSGQAKTAFPDGRPTVEGESEDDGNTEAQKELSQAEHLTESTDSIAVVLFADTDMLDDRMWVNVEEFYGQLVAQPWASNSDLIMNVLEKLSGSVDLINVRSRGTYNRPFEKVIELEREASERLRQEEAVLQEKLAQTESRIAELSRPEEAEAEEFDAETGMPQLNQQQQAEIDKFHQQRWEIRKKLREVQHQLNRDIERLGSILKWLNMLGVPALIAIFVLCRSFFRRRRLMQLPGSH